MRKLTAAFIVAGLILATGLRPLHAAGFSDQAVGEAIKKGVEYLWSQQGKDGTWSKYGKGPGDKNYHPYGPTALATLALLSAGESPQGANMRKALDALSKAVQTETGTYTLGLMGNVFMLANRQTQGKYRQQLRTVMNRLVKSTKNGSFGYRSEGKGDSSGDHSNSQYGLLGVWGARLGFEEVPKKFWSVVMRHWLSTQSADGGWAYKWEGSKDGVANPSGAQSTHTMTAAGVASLFVCFDNLFADAFIKCETSSHFSAIQRGLDWFDRNFATSDGKIDLAGRKGYYLYGVERVGLASGYKYFGEADWYKLGAEHLLKEQGRKGSWGGGKGGEVETSFCLLFLIRGRHPVLMNKLEYDSDWNNRPRDCAGLTRWVTTTFEKEVAWQIINLKVPVSEWHDAPLLYISGAKDPGFLNSDTAIAKLRDYVLQGGTIFSCTECGGEEFADGIRKAYAKMFPKLELTPIGPDHVLYSSDLQFKLGGNPKLFVMSNGVRPFVIHTDQDLPLQWQMNRTSSRGRAFEAAANIAAYVTDKWQMRRRGVTHWPDDPKVTPIATIAVDRLKHSGNYDPEPRAYERLRRLFLKETHLQLRIGEPVDPTKVGESGAKIALMTGTGQMKLSSDEKAAIEKFVRGGGTLVVDAAGGNEAFEDSANKQLRELFDDAFSTIPASSPLYNPKNVEAGNFRWRRRSRIRFGPNAGPRLRAITIDGRMAVFFSREDITAGLVGYQSFDIDGYAPGTNDDPGSAYRVMRNILLHASPRDAAKIPAEAKTTRGR
ncbi:MAG: DUF4159 domain-containing protein [Phycisphaerae bacterium]